MAAALRWGTDWMTDDMVTMYQNGCLIRQPNIEPGSRYFDPSKFTVLDCMAIKPS